MNDLISRQAAIDAIKREIWDKHRAKDIIDTICNIPSAQPERKKGEWIYKNDLKQFFCNQCGEPSLTDDDVYIYDMPFPNFCPNCGADMRGEKDE